MFFSLALEDERAETKTSKQKPTKKEKKVGIFYEILNCPNFQRKNL
jgi:hypothetical protein